MSKVCLLVISRREVSGAGKTEDGLVQYNEEVNRLEDDLRELYETIRVNVDEEEQWKVFDFVEDFFMEELEIGDYINDINSYHLHMFDKHDVTTKKFDLSDGGTLGFRRAILEDDNLANIDSLYNAAVAVDKFYSQECREW